MIIVGYVGVMGCDSPREIHNATGDRESRCDRIAADYRAGNYLEIGSLALLGCFESRVGKMTEADVRRLLGEPRVLTPRDQYYGHALTRVYGHETISDPDWVNGNAHDRVLHYGELGPPEHRIPDESYNLFFIIKDAVVIDVHSLCP